MNDYDCTKHRMALIEALGVAVLVVSIAGCGNANSMAEPDVTQRLGTPDVGTVAGVVSAGTAGGDASPVSVATRAGEGETPSVAPDTRITLEFVTQPAPRGEDVAGGGDRPSEAEIAALVRKSLEYALVEGQIPDHHLLTDPRNVVLSTENIDAALVSDLPGVHLLLSTPEEIQAVANADGDYLYLRFQPLAFKSADEVIVFLDNAWAIDRTDATPKIYLSGGGFEVRFVREADGWIGYLMGSWIS
jgi:hypothetical protein